MTRYSLVRVKAGQYGWAILDNEGDAAPWLVVDGSQCVGLSRWEARQTLGLLGLAYDEPPQQPVP